MSVTPLRWTSHGNTHIGNVRKVNQDALLDRPDNELWVVADGMGGHRSGEIASAAIVEGLNALPPGKTLGVSVKHVYRTLEQVHRQLLGLAAARHGNEIIGSTVALMLANHRHCVFLWSGDSRIYLFRNGRLAPMTRDHNYEQALLAAGYTQDEIAVHPYVQMITHAVGAEQILHVESRIEEIKPGDLFLLCSDGLNKEMTDDEIEQILNNNSVDTAVTRLLDLPLERDARDNVTVIVAEVR